jgi:hypothetical protein
VADAIKTMTLTGAYVQENGIIRLSDGRYIGRLDGVTFEEVVTREAQQHKYQESPLRAE